jgi:hypothetical protein
MDHKVLQVQLVLQENLALRVHKAQRDPKVQLVKLDLLEKRATQVRKVNMVNPASPERTVLKVLLVQLVPKVLLVNLVLKVMMVLKVLKVQPVQPDLKVRMENLANQDPKEKKAL